MTRQQLNSRYKRILGAGLAVSLLVHGAILGLGRLKLETRGPAAAQLSVVTLPEPADTRAAAPEADGDAADPGAAAAAPASGPELPAAEVPEAPPLADYRVVLAEALASPPVPPLVPRPRMVAMRVESALAPARLNGPVRLAARDGDRRDGGPDIGIAILVGAGGYSEGSCQPAAINLRYPSRHSLAGSGLRSAGFRLRVGARR